MYKYLVLSDSIRITPIVWLFSYRNLGVQHDDVEPVRDAGRPLQPGHEAVAERVSSGMGRVTPKLLFHLKLSHGVGISSIGLEYPLIILCLTKLLK